MPPLPTRPSSPCVFCAWSARWSRPQAQRLLPRTQVAHRSDSSGKRSDSTIFARRPWQQRHGNSFKRLDGTVSVPFANVRQRLELLRNEFVEPKFRESLGLSERDFDKEWLSFERSISQWIKQAPPELQTLAKEDARGKETLSKRLRYLFYAQACGGKFTTAELQNQKEVADLRYPAEWFPATREIQRTVHLHVGPTNSGKTYHALKRLEEADTGIYLGPLRLLAHEVYTRLNAKNKTCALVTGDEQRMPDGDRPNMFSCTVEMAPLNARFDVAVIDEIQMISHPERGWAWTQAYLGLQAKEIHLCGEARTVPIMRELAALAGDEVHVHEYERLTPLQVMPESLRGNLDLLEKGDCIVAFTIIGIHALRREIETRTGKHCAIVYGSLPPETRAQQARLFNDPDNDYDYLVASDAIGMGLNLAIKRVIFESTMKSNGLYFTPLVVSDVKQIAGRAGRFKTAQQAINSDTQASDPVIGLDDTPSLPPSEPKVVGWVTTLDEVDHQHLKQSMTREPAPIHTAGLFPPALIIERFANYFPPGTPFSYILLRLHEISELHPRFHICELKDQLAIADAIHSIKSLSIQERITLCAAPTNMREQIERDFIHSLAECIATNRTANLLELEYLPLHVMDVPPVSGRVYLYELERLHKMLVTYLWLSYRFPNVLVSRTLANYAKKLVEDKIEATLTRFSFVHGKKEKIEKQKKMARTRKEQENAERLEQQQQRSGHDSDARAVANEYPKKMSAIQTAHDIRTPSATLQH
ncbi:hypothetical protein J1614_001331 [Plenodomus biglobosus]|nr:hypothetical protein J1614_001331 [Plenodomus biglobosus]